MNTLGAGR
ncbi:hypothetical protein LINPERPRIM_LOCUS15305 [Linum perenne]